MVYLFKICAVLLLFPGILLAETKQLREARAYSFLLRDHGLDRIEFETLLKGDTKLESLIVSWMDSKDHISRMERYFDDMMGIRDGMTILQPDSRLDLTADAVYFNQKKGSCSSVEAVSVKAWWLPAGETTRVCPNLNIEQLSFPDGKKTIVCTRPGRNGFLNPLCGCGPQMISCIPAPEANRLVQEARKEFSTRAVNVYQKHQTWLDLLAGDKFYGTRRLYWLYFQGQSLQNPKLYTIEAIQAILDLPLDQAEERAFPAGAERSGIATAPSFLVQYNNFRSRIAGLTRSFLCQDVNPTLNTDDVKTFFNPSLSANDLAHGQKESCADCHYALDNLGSALLPWSDLAVYNAEISTIAYAFGAQGKGPDFLMSGYVQRAPGFVDCMAKRAWEDFSGQTWLDLPEDQKLTVRAWVNAGPREMLHALFTSSLLKSALSPAVEPANPDDGISDEEWAVTAPILQRSCAGSSCHSQGGRQPAYTEDKSLWARDQTKLLDRLQRTGPGQMPPASSGRVLSVEERDQVLQLIR